MTDAFKPTRTVEPKSVNKPVKQNRTVGYGSGRKVDSSELTPPKRRKSSTRGKSFTKANGTRSGVMLPPVGRQ